MPFSCDPRRRGVSGSRPTPRWCSVDPGGRRRDHGHQPTPDDARLGVYPRRRPGGPRHGPQSGSAYAVSASVARVGALASLWACRPSLTRSRFLRAALGTAGALALAPSRSWAAATRSAAGRASRCETPGAAYEGDRALFATVSPGVPGRDTAVVSFELSARRASSSTSSGPRCASARSSGRLAERLASGQQSMTWTPDPDTAVGTYVIRLTVESGNGRDAGSTADSGPPFPAGPGARRPRARHRGGVWTTQLRARRV